MIKKLKFGKSKGQSLVEMTLAMPFLVILFIGLIELGAALRSYQILINANREGVRLAARGRFFDLDQEGGYDSRGADSIFSRIEVAAGYEGSNPEQLVPALRFTKKTVGADPFEPNSSGIITSFRISCESLNPGGPQVNICEDEGAVFDVQDYYQVTQWTTGTIECESQLGALNALAQGYVFANRDFNLEHDLDIATNNDIVAVELCFEHEQWLKFPIFELPPVNFVLPDPIPMYVQSKMRVTLSTRSQ